LVTTVLVIGVFWLAYSNGANDNFKGVATIYGSSTVTFRQALALATIATAAGSIVSVFAAGKLVAVFSGKGLIPDELSGTTPVLIAVGVGGALTISLATWLGLPTSTTHALMGGLLGVAVAGSAEGIHWGGLFYGFAMPMLLSPAIAVMLAGALYLTLRHLRTVAGVTRQTCLCIGNRIPVPVHVREDGTAVMAESSIRITVDQLENCEERYVGKFFGMTAQSLVNGTHYLSGAAVCFSRAVNDTPKIAALLLVVHANLAGWVLIGVAVAMILGGLWNSRGVAETMSHRITDLTPGQGLSANLVTALLVLFASSIGLPVSTTHVSCGSIFGIGMANQTFRWKTVAEISAAWVTTLPMAGLVSGVLFFWMTRGF
jgi:PiT family inorganic phosphate transporter